MDKPITFNEWLGTQGNMVLLHANCCRIAFEGGQQSQQAKVEELQRRNQMLNDNIKEQGQKLVYQNEVIETQAEKLLGLRDEKAELQKRVKFLEQELGAWKGKSIAAMVNGMCKQCGKEPLQAIVSDKECYALLHCFGCGADKYELIGEQALKGEGQ
ncbi:hypothetical protein [Acinetobacter baumannii]|uniref:hypothetical protein n=1 Tax=Acinetobacter baumannii TaxID=470 RepID=UPI001126911F|nr:hypothetical protein [Acinetobacter baumannii]TPT82315.1 hypothetical protein FJU59_07765 [Acinetobacter baumannii]